MVNSNVPDALTKVILGMKTLATRIKSHLREKRYKISLDEINRFIYRLLVTWYHIIIWNI